MGQKVHPYSFRLGITKNWLSRWYSRKDYHRLLAEDQEIRLYLTKKLAGAAISKIELERAAGKVKVTVHSARPGLVIGKKGVGIDQIRNDVQRFTKDRLFLNVVEVRKPEIDAQLVAESIAQQLEKRVAFRRAMKKAMVSAFKFGAKGVKVRCSGRLGGAEIARTEWYADSSVPLHTLRADIDYGFAEASTTYGQIGVKAWVYKGLILSAEQAESAEIFAQAGA